MREPLDAHQVEGLPLVLRQTVDRFEDAAADRGEAGVAADVLVRQVGEA